MTLSEHEASAFVKNQADMLGAIAKQPSRPAELHQAYGQLDDAVAATLQAIEALAQRLSPYVRHEPEVSRDGTVQDTAYSTEMARRIEETTGRVHLARRGIVSLLDRLEI